VRVKLPYGYHSSTVFFSDQDRNRTNIRPPDGYPFGKVTLEMMPFKSENGDRFTVGTYWAEVPDDLSAIQLIDMMEWYRSDAAASEHVEYYAYSICKTGQIVIDTVYTGE
jgi:hypothetical protein